MSSWKAAVFANLLAAFSIGALHAEEAKGYLVGLVHLTNKDWIAEYRSQNGPLLEKYGGRILVRGPAAEVLEGEAPEADAILLVEFPSIQQAQAWYQDPEYQPLIELRQTGADVDFVLVEELQP